MQQGLSSQFVIEKTPEMEAPFVAHRDTEEAKEGEGAKGSSGECNERGLSERRPVSNS